MNPDKSSQSTCMVTGGAGYIGSLVARQLAAGGARVICYDWNIADNSIHITLSAAERARLKMVQGDVSDLATLLGVAQQEGVNRIIHLAYLLAPVSEKNPSLAARVNIVGVNNVFECARILNIQRVVWASSASVWGQFFLGEAPADHPVEAAPLKEDAPHHPTTLYGATKSLNEFMARRFTENYGLDIIGLRMSRTFGIGKTSGEGREFMAVLWKVAKQQPVVIPDADFVKSYAHGEDIARAFVLAAQVDKTKTKIFNTHGFEHYSNRELVGILKELQPDAPVTLKPSRPGAYGGYRLDASAIRQELGYAPRYSLREILKEILDGFRRMSSMDEKRRD